MECICHVFSLGGDSLNCENAWYWWSGACLRDWKCFLPGLNLKLVCISTTQVKQCASAPSHICSSKEVPTCWHLGLNRWIMQHNVKVLWSQEALTSIATLSYWLFASIPKNLEFPHWTKSTLVIWFHLPLRVSIAKGDFRKTHPSFDFALTTWVKHSLDYQQGW